MGTISAPDAKLWNDRGTVLQLADSCYATTAEPLPQGRWRIWYGDYGGFNGERFNIGVAEGVPGREMVSCSANLSTGKPAEGRLSIGNLPADWRPIQPKHFVLPDGKERLYFWVHGPGVVRLLVAQSDDGRRFEVLDPHRPVLWHYNDRAYDNPFDTAGLTPSAEKPQRPPGEPAAPLDQVGNDALYIYLRPDGSWEFYGVGLNFVSRDDPRFIAHDNAPGCIRVIERRTSADGLHWSAPQRVIEPDENDPADLQFYLVSVNPTKAGYVGLLSHYRVQAQTTDIEWCFSPDGINWQRPYRRPWFERDVEKSGCYGIYPSVSAVQHEGLWWLFYTACNFTHNRGKCSGKSPLSEIRLATIDRLYEESNGDDY